jgi:hypothetical protein
LQNGVALYDVQSVKRQESATGLPSDAVLSNCLSERGFLVLPEELTEVSLKLLFGTVLQGRPVMSCQVSPLELFFQQGINLLIPQWLWLLVLIVPEHKAYVSMLTLATTWMCLCYSDLPVGQM